MIASIGFIGQHVVFLLLPHISYIGSAEPNAILFALQFSDSSDESKSTINSDSLTCPLTIKSSTIPNYFTIKILEIKKNIVAIGKHTSQFDMDCKSYKYSWKISRFPESQGYTGKLNILFSYSLC